MKLKDFVATFVYPNSLIRLWVPIKDGHKMLHKGNDSVCMEWELLKNKTWLSLYNDHEVIGVTDIVSDDFYREAINIVIKEK